MRKLFSIVFLAATACEAGVCGDGVLDAQAVLQALDPQPGALDVELASAHLDGLRDAQAVPEEHEQQRVVTNAVTALLGCLEQAIALRTCQEVLGALVGIGRSCATLYLSPVGRHRCVPQKC